MSDKHAECARNHGDSSSSLENASAGTCVGMVSLPRDITESMRRWCEGRTGEALQRQFGISYNTWRRIDAGAPIRRSLALRVISKTKEAVSHKD